MKLKTTNRQYQAIETRKKIYDSADFLFRTHGVDNVSVDSIVKNAGVSKGTFYVHFESKYSLIATLITEYVAELDLDYKSYLESFPVNTPASDILKNFVGNIADIIEHKVTYDLMKKVYEALITRSIDSDSILGYNRDLYKTFKSIVHTGVEQGEFNKDINIDSITNNLVLALRGITFEWCVRYPDFNYKEQVLKHFDILLIGIIKH